MVGIMLLCAIYLCGDRCPVFPGYGPSSIRSLRSELLACMNEFVHRSTCGPFRHVLGDVRREWSACIVFRGFIKHGSRGSYLRDALRDASFHVVACFSGPWACVRLFPPPLLAVASIAFVLININNDVMSIVMLLYITSHYTCSHYY
jgi:hypothetical protein